MTTRRKIPSGIEIRGDSYRVRISRNGLKRSGTFEDLDDAIKARNKWLAESDGDIDHRKESAAALVKATTLRDVLIRYLHEVTPTKKGAKQESIRIKAFLREQWADLPIASVSRDHIREWRDRRMADGVAPSTIRNPMNLLHRIFFYAKSEWNIDVENPVAGLIKPPQRQPRIAQPDDDLERLLIATAASSKAPWMAQWITIAAWTALRAGEIRALRWGDIDFDQHFIHLKDTKNGSSRDVPMLDEVEAVFIAMRGDDRDGEDWVFPAASDDTKPMPTMTPTVAFRRIMERVATDNPGVMRVTLHDLRHWACTRLADYHVDALDLSITTGHKSLQILRRYYNPRPGTRAARIRARAASRKQEAS